MSRQSNVLLGVVAAGAALGIIVGVGAAAADQRNDDAHEAPSKVAEQETPIPAEADLPELEVPTDNVEGTTRDGRTYGTLPVPSDPRAGQTDPKSEVLPDLVAVEGDSGKRGYVVAEDLMDEPDVSNPEEAREYMKNRKRTRELPVYAKDGITVIDTFTITNGEGTNPTS